MLRGKARTAAGEKGLKALEEAWVSDSVIVSDKCTFIY
jgi:hypothetical protein